MARIGIRMSLTLIFGSTLTLATIGVIAGKATMAQSTAAPSASSASAAAVPTHATPAASSPRRRRARRRYTSATPTQPAAVPEQQTVGPTPAQRLRDAQILALQKAQSAETARQQAIVTGNVIKERQAQQAEPRIQEAPGPGSRPLPGQPGVIPAQASDSSGIQDAPGPAQTLPKMPPPAAAAPNSQPSSQSSPQSAPPQ